jgi:16S rRNA processing protein RimM
MSDRIALGRIRKAHGLRGDASVEAWSELERFREVTDVTLVSPDETQTREVKIESTREHSDRLLIKFSGIATPEEVQALHGWTIEIPTSQARKLDDDEYFLHDLVGMHLVDREGKDRGEVIEAYEGGGGVLLNVRRGGDGRQYEVPFAASICVAIDVKAKMIVVDLPEGIDED